MGVERGEPSVYLGRADEDGQGRCDDVGAIVPIQSIPIDKRTERTYEAGTSDRERQDKKLPIVPFPSEQELARRKLLASYGREMKNRTKLINLLHVMFVHQGHTMIVKKDLATTERRREAVEILSGQEREEAE